MPQFLSNSLFLTQRYKQTRTDITEPKIKKGRCEWVISRSLCYYRLFDLTAIPVAQRAHVLTHRIKQWSVFSHYGQYIVWQKEKAQVWIWNQERCDTLQQDLMLSVKNVVYIPETLLKLKSENEFVIVKLSEGYEMQVWLNGYLSASHWLDHSPSNVEIASFQRKHKLNNSTSIEHIDTSELLEKPWGKNKRGVQLGIVYAEKTVNYSIILILFSVLCWQITSIWKWKQATTDVLQQIDILSEETAQILDARNQVLKNLEIIEQLHTLVRFPTQLEIMLAAAKSLPTKSARFVEWDYQLDSLSITIQSISIDPILYVTAFQKAPFFENVTIENTSKKDELKVRMNIVEIK